MLPAQQLYSKCVLRLSEAISMNFWSWLEFLNRFCFKKMGKPLLAVLLVQVLQRVHRRRIHVRHLHKMLQMRVLRRSEFSKLLRLTLASSVLMRQVEPLLTVLLLQVLICVHRC